MSGVFRTQGVSVTAMTIRFPQAFVINLGESPRETYRDRLRKTRPGTASIIRQTFVEAVRPIDDQALNTSRDILVKSVY